MIDKFKQLIQQVKDLSSSLISDKEGLSKNSIIFTQYVRFGLIGTAILIMIYFFFSFTSGANAKAAAAAKTKVKEETMTLETANKAVDGDKMWRNLFEEKITETGTIMNSRLKAIEDNFNEKAKELAEENKREITSIKEQLGFARRELADASNKMSTKNTIVDEPRMAISNYSIHKFDKDFETNTPKSSRNYIPEATHLTGKLLGGIAVSTAVNSSQEPVPVFIRITDRGSLPKNFDINLKECKIKASCYGQLNSQRAVIRAESMTCVDKKNELVYTTNIAGTVYGDDGINGIKGQIIDHSQKYLNHAIASSLIGGLAQATKDSAQATVNPFGLVQTKKSDFNDNMRSGAISGIGDAGAKIAEYSLKQAESISPVIIIKGGTSVDVVFTEGVHLHSTNVKEKIKNARK